MDFKEKVNVWTRDCMHLFDNQRAMLHDAEKLLRGVDSVPFRKEFDIDIDADINGVGAVVVAYGADEDGTVYVVFDDGDAMGLDEMSVDDALDLCLAMLTRIAEDDASGEDCGA